MKTPTVILLAMFLASCASAPPVPPEAGPLKLFLDRCRSDLENAKKVLVSNDLVKNLSHLQLMDHGGKKYYLLERENITALIRSVTEGAYSDFILINKQGVVVYTMGDDDIFGANVLAGLKKTVFNACFENRDTDPFISPGPSHPKDQKHTIVISSKVSGGNTMPGIFILMVDLSKIREIIGKRSSIIDTDGNYVVADDYRKINTRFNDFNKIDLATFDDGSTARFAGGQGGAAVYRFLRYGNLRWIIVTE
jgi:hypothetical protein